MQPPLVDLGQAAEKYMKSGKLVPDEMMVKLITSELAGIKTSSWLLDGFPRTRAQAEALGQHEKVWQQGSVQGGC